MFKPKRYFRRTLVSCFLYLALIIGACGIISQVILLLSKLKMYYFKTSHYDQDPINITEKELAETMKYIPILATHLSYDKNFSFPLDIDIAHLVKEKIQNNVPISQDPINPHPFNYINQPKPCDFKLNGTGLNQSDTILVLVKSTAKNFLLRRAIRIIWRFEKDAGIKTVFMLGYDGVNQTGVNDESDKHNDIIQEDFVDAYRNNTHKTVMGFNWALQQCSQAQFLFFMDDDYYLKMKDLARYLRKMPEDVSETLFIGSLSKSGVPYRDKSTRWYISPGDYPFDKYPPYLGGGAYVISTSVAKTFQIAFPYVKFIPIDDAYLGIVAKKLKFAPHHDERFRSYYRGAIAKECSHEPAMLVKQDCPLSYHGYEWYVHKNKKLLRKESGLLRGVLITIFVVIAVSFCALCPLFLCIYCDSYIMKTIHVHQKPKKSFK